QPRQRCQDGSDFPPRGGRDRILPGQPRPQGEPAMATMNEFNTKVIDEFRANAGKVGGMFTGAPMLILHTTGAKSGKSYATPLVYLPDGDRWVIIASKAGAATSPDWFHNLVSHPDAEIEVGSERVRVRAEVVGSAERDRLYDKQASIMPQF